MTALTDRQQRVYAALKAADMPLTVAEVAEETGISTARVRDILRALQAFGLADMAGVSMTRDSRTWKADQ
jgi:DNA-binding transcriptional regulator GbsR (MarR family)